MSYSKTLLSMAEINPTIRPEKLSVNEWVSLFRKFIETQKS